MYIPDRITLQINAQTKGITVFSADEGHEADDALRVEHVHIDWDWRAGVSVQVDYGMPIRSFGDPPQPETVRVEYGPQAVVSIGVMESE